MQLSAVAFAVGVALLQWLPVLPAPTTYLTTAVAAVAAVLAGRGLRSARRTALVAAAALLAGFAWAAWRADVRLGEHLPPAWEGRDIEVVGIVAEMPQPFPRGERFAFDIEQVLTPAALLPARVMLSWYGGTEDASPAGRLPLRPGERWRFTVRLKRPHGNANPHAFDYEAWLLERNVRATGYVRPAPAAQRLDAQVWQADYAIERLRHAIRQHFLDTLAGADYAGVLVALAVGDQRAIQGEFWRVFARTGTTHLMSISGLHVTMVAAILGALAGFLWRRSPRLMARQPAQRVAVLVGWLAALGYALLSGFSVPAQRTAYMLSVAALALLCGRRTAPAGVMALALWLVLLVDPWAVLAPGFWLSFGAVALLFYVAVGRVAGARGWRPALARWGAAQWAVTLGSLPLLLLFFQQFSLVSPLANALAIPVVSFLVTPLALLAIVVPLPALLQLDHWLFAWLMEALVRMADLPVLERAAPPLALVALGVAGVVWLLLPRGVPARGSGILLLVPALFYAPPRPPVGEAWITVLDVGQGLAVVARTASKTLLYDTGPMYSAESDAGQRIVVPYLRAIGVGSLDALIVTHGDSDHAGGAASVLAAMPVLRTLSSVPELPGESCAAGQQWEWDGVRFSMLHPPAGAVPDAALKPNHRSCVLRIAAGDASILLTSDIEAVDERALLERDAAALRADVLLVPHHGSRTSSTPAFIAAVGASDVIYPVGYRNRFGHPRADIVARYGSVRAWRSDADGAISVRLGDGARLAAWRREHPRYWHGR